MRLFILLLGCCCFALNFREMAKLSFSNSRLLDDSLTAGGELIAPEQKIVPTKESSSTAFKEPWGISQLPTSSSGTTMGLSTESRWSNDTNGGALSTTTTTTSGQPGPTSSWLLLKNLTTQIDDVQTISSSGTQSQTPAISHPLSTSTKTSFTPQVIMIKSQRYFHQWFVFSDFKQQEEGHFPCEHHVYHNMLHVRRFFNTKGIKYLNTIKVSFSLMPHFAWLLKYQMINSDFATDHTV